MPDGSRSFERSQSPDLDRVAELFREHFVFVRRVLRRCGIAPADLDDAVQETFLVVHRRAADFEGRASERTWLYAVAVRVASTLRRSARREQARRTTAGQQMHSGSEADPEDALSRNEAAEVLDALLDELDANKRTVFVLAELEGVRVPEIARILDVNVRTIHSRLRLARERFSAALARHHAREQGRMQRASLSTLARQARPRPPSRASTRASWAALAVRISDGAQPLPIAWSAGAGAVAKTSSFLLPFALTVGVGSLGVMVVSSVVPATTSESRRADPESDAPPTRAVSPELAAAPGLDPGSVETPPHLSSATPIPALASSEASEPPEGRPVSVPRSRRRDRAPTDGAPSERPPVVGAQTDTPRTRAPGPGVSQAETLAAEATLLETARAQLARGAYAQVLTTLDEHETRFATGVLATERESTRIKALCGAGRREQAEARVRGTASKALRAVFAARCTE